MDQADLPSSLLQATMLDILLLTNSGTSLGYSTIGEKILT